MGQNLNIAVEILGKDSASGPLGAVTASLGKLGSAGGAAATVLAGVTVAAGGALVAGLGASIGAATGFEAQMSSVKAVSGATAEEMQRLSGLARQLGKDTSFSASEAAAGIEELVKGGLSIPDIMSGAAAATLNLAAAGGVSLPDAATIAANALAQFNLKGEDMARVADLIAGAANASALDVGQFKQSLQAAGAVASTVGFSFDDLAQAIAVMGKAGITGSDAGTSLKTMMMNLVPQTDKAAGIMRDLGIAGLNTQRAMAELRANGIQPISESSGELQTQLFKMWAAQNKVTSVTPKVTKAFNEWLNESKLMTNQFFTAEGQVKSMAEVAGVLQKAMANLTKEEQIKALGDLFGSDAIRAAAVLAKEGAAGFETMAASMGKVTAAGVGAEKLNNLKGSIEQLKGSLETAGITLGLAFLPQLKQLTDGATAAVNAAMPFLEAYGPRLAAAIGGGLAAVSGAAAQIGPALQDLGQQAQAAFLLLQMGWQAVTSAFQGGTDMQAALAGLPDGLRQVADAALGLATSAGEHVRALVAIVQQAFSGDLPGAVTNLLDLLVNGRTDLIETLAGWGRALVEWLAPMIPPLLAEAGKVAQAVFAWAQAKAPELLEKLQEWGRSLIAWVQPYIPPLLAELGKVAQQVLAWVVQQGPPLLQQFITEWVPSFVNWLLEAGTALVPKLKAFVDGILPWIEAEGPVLVRKFFAEWVPAFIGWVAEAAVKIGPKLGEFLLALGRWGAEVNPRIHRLFISLGIAAVQGIYEGLKQLEGWLQEKARELLLSVLDAAKKAIWASSPSRLFAEQVGEPIAEGIAAGLVAAWPLVDRSMSGGLERLGRDGATAAQQSAYVIAESFGETLRARMLAEITKGHEQAKAMLASRMADLARSGGLGRTERGGGFADGSGGARRFNRGGEITDGSGGTARGSRGGGLADGSGTAARAGRGGVDIVINNTIDARGMTAAQLTQAAGADLAELARRRVLSGAL